MKIIGLTGGIASGKSLVAATLEKLGAIIIDADVIARSIVCPGCPALEEIRACFGGEMILPDGELDRGKLARLIFSDAEARRQLNGITHWRIKAEIARQLEEIRQKNDAAIAVVDAALLIEIGLVDLVDEIWLVTLSEELQLARLIARDGLSQEAAKQRLAAQMTLAEKTAAAQRLIDNSGNPDKTIAQVIRLWQTINLS